jgi:hypothetical protein
MPQSLKGLGFNMAAEAIKARSCGRDELAKALVNARERTLWQFDALQNALGPEVPVPFQDNLNPFLYLNAFLLVLLAFSFPFNAFISWEHRFDIVMGNFGLERKNSFINHFLVKHGHGFPMSNTISIITIGVPIIHMFLKWQIASTWG